MAISKKLSDHEQIEFFEGYRTALKPSWEPILLAMKSLDGNFIQNAINWQIAGYNIDDCRIGSEIRVNAPAGNKKSNNVLGFGLGMNSDQATTTTGRYPANTIFSHSHDCTEDVCAEDCPIGIVRKSVGYADRFFQCFDAEPFVYSGKASRSERGTNNHPTLKPLKVMTYLLKLIKPPGKDRIVLDPFIGSGTTALAAEQLGMKWIGIERELQYARIAKERILKQRKSLNNQ